MRVPLALLAATSLALALTPAASAQEDGCIQANPCLFDVEVDEDGIASLSVDNMTSGDWFYLGVSNLDGRAHSLTFASVQVQVGAYGYVDSQAFQAPAAGDHELRDQPTGDVAVVHVLEGDVVEAEQSASDADDGSQDEEKGAPGPGLVVVLATLGAAAFAARRRLL